MRQAFLYDDFDLRIDDIKEPEPGDGEVQVQIGFGGICKDLTRCMKLAHAGMQAAVIYIPTMALLNGQTSLTS